MITRVALVITLVGQAAAQSPGADTAREPGFKEYQAADSIVLERGPCYGTCPVYRVSITRSGDVHFVSLAGHDSGVTRLRHIDPDKFSSLTMIAMRGRFFSLGTLMDDPKFCPEPLTDAPSAYVTLFLQNRRKKVSDYYGCTWTPFILRSLENAIDEEADTRRWLR